MDPGLFFLLALVGILAGLASGLLGIGGGVVMVPALLLLLALGFREAVAVSLLVMVVAALPGLVRHHRAGNVRLRLGLVIGGAGFVGVLAAFLVDPLLSESALTLLFAGLLVFSAHRVVYGELPERTLDAPWLLGLVGFLSGFVAKLFGVGGGIVIVPGLVFMGHGMHMAVGTSLVSVWTNAVLSTGLNVAQGFRGWLPAVPLALGSLLGTYIGAWGAIRSHATTLRRGFGVLLVYVALTMAERGLG